MFLRGMSSIWCNVLSGAMTMVDRLAKINLLENILHEHNLPSHYMKLLPHVT